MSHHYHIPEPVPPEISRVCLIDNPDTTIVFEVVTTCDRNIVDHLKACFLDSDQVDEVRIVTFQKNEHKKLQTKIETEDLLKPFREKIIYESLETYVKELWP